MLDFLLEAIPLWGWAIPAGAALFFAWRYLGFRGMIAAAAAIATLGVYRHGRKTGSAAERAKQKAREQKARDVADEVDNDIGAMPPDKARKELGKW